MHGAPVCGQRWVCHSQPAFLHKRKLARGLPSLSCGHTVVRTGLWGDASSRSLLGSALRHRTPSCGDAALLAPNFETRSSRAAPPLRRSDNAGAREGRAPHVREEQLPPRGASRRRALPIGCQ